MKTMIILCSLFVSTTLSTSAFAKPDEGITKIKVTKAAGPKPSGGNSPSEMCGLAGICPVGMNGYWSTTELRCICERGVK